MNIGCHLEKEENSKKSLKADNGLGLLIVMHKVGGPNTKLGRTLSSPFYDLILLQPPQPKTQHTPNPNF